jgi:hypothetical protein
VCCRHRHHPRTFLAQAEHSRRFPARAIAVTGGNSRPETMVSGALALPTMRQSARARAKQKGFQIAVAQRHAPPAVAR